MDLRYKKINHQRYLTNERDREEFEKKYKCYCESIKPTVLDYLYKRISLQIELKQDSIY